MKIMRSVSGKRPRMWGPSIIGYGKRSYELASGKQEEICRIGFSPRRQALAFYLGKIPGQQGLLKRLGKHRQGQGGCLYINKLEDIDADVLQEMIEKAWSR